MPVADRAWFGRLTGAILITEGLLVAIVRLVTVAYVLASEAYSADRFRTPGTTLLGWLSITVVFAGVLIWAGSLLRREPTGTWARVGIGARVDLIAACVLNVGLFVWAVVAMVGRPATADGWLTWIAIGAITLLACIGLVRDALTGGTPG